MNMYRHISYIIINVYEYLYVLMYVYYTCMLYMYIIHIYTFMHEKFFIGWVGV